MYAVNWLPSSDLDGDDVSAGCRRYTGRLSHVRPDAREAPATDYSIDEATSSNSPADATLELPVSVTRQVALRGARFEGSAIIARVID